jgi:predicted RNA-binding protein (virulence factor B family)
VGTKCRGFIQRIRSDGKLDLSLARSGADARLDSGKAILEALRKAGGSLPLGDKSDPAEIQRILGMSKKAFKRAIGGLYRARRIEISDTEIRIRTPESRD